MTSDRSYTHTPSYPIERYLNARNAYNPTFAANGRFLTFLTDISGLAQVWRVPLPDPAAAQETCYWPEQLTFGSERVLSVQQSPAPGDNRLIFTRDVGGNENAQLYLLDPDSGTEQCLTSGYPDAMHIPGDWSADGRFLLFSANRRHPAQFDLYRLSLETGAADIVWLHENAGYLWGATFSPDGRFAAVVRAAQSAEHDLFLVELVTGQTRRLNPTGRAARYHNLAYDKNGRFLYLNTDLDHDFLHVARVDLATRKWERLVAPNWDVELLTIAPNGRFLAYVVNVDGDSRVELLDLAFGRARVAPLPAGAPGVVGLRTDGLAFAADSSRLAFAYSRATRSYDVYVWDLDAEAERVRRVTASSHGGIPVETFVAPQLVHYPTFDGRAIPAWWYRPLAEEDLPVVVMVHGGPESQARPFFNFLIQYFVHNGYAILVPNVRGSTGYGRAYSRLDDVEKRMDAVADLAHAARWLKAQPGIDGARLAVYGGSYGGFMVLSALTTYPDLWAAGVSIVGISNFVTFLENTSGYRRSHRESEYGSLAHHRDFLESISPLNYVDQVRAPLMVIHGANDPRVPLSEAEQLVAALRERGVPAEFLVFDDEGHGLAKLKNKLTAYPAVVAFLDRYLRGG